MALINFHGFDNTPSPQAQGQLVLSNGFSSIGTVTNLTKQPALSASGSSLGFANTGALYILMGDPGGFTNHVSLVSGCRWQFSVNPVATIQILAFIDGSTFNIGVAINTSRQLFVYRNTVATVIATGTTVLLSGSVYEIELKAIFATTATGSYEVRINGVTEPNLSASGTVQTAVTNAFSQSVAFASGSGSSATDEIDDLYLCDLTGSVANDFLATSSTAIRVETVYPTSNNSVVFTPLANANWQEVDEANFDSDTSYNFSTASGDIDTFNHGSITSTPITIFGVKVDVAARKDDVSNQQIRTKLISGSTTSNGTSKTLNTIYTTSSDVYPTDPNASGSAWSASTVNATKIGYEHV